MTGPGLHKDLSTENVFFFYLLSDILDNTVIFCLSSYFRIIYFMIYISPSSFRLGRRWVGFQLWFCLQVKRDTTAGITFFAQSLLRLLKWMRISTFSVISKGKLYDAVITHTGTRWVSFTSPRTHITHKEPMAENKYKLNKYKVK